MKKLRILVISHMYPCIQGRNLGIYICREAEYLAKYDIEFSFLVPRAFCPWPLYQLSKWKFYGPENKLIQHPLFSAERIPYLRIPGYWYYRFDGRAMALAVKSRAAELHRQKPFDLIMGVSIIQDGEAAMMIGRRLHLPVVTLAVGSDVMVYTKDIPCLWNRLGAILEQVDLPAGVSQSICRRMAETGRCRREPYCVYLSRDTSSFQPVNTLEKIKIRQKLGIGTDDIVGIYVGNIIETKGIRELSEVLAELGNRYEKFKMICVGGGSALEVLVQARRRLNRPESLILPGAVPPEKVQEYLKVSDFFVLPSYSEGLPQAIIEAMNCGLAVVATRVGGIPEAIIDGDSGLLIEAKDSLALKHAMERVITDHEFRQMAGKKGYEYARTKFDPEINARKFSEALWNLVKK